MSHNKTSVNTVFCDFDINIKALMIQTCILGVLRLVTLDLMAMISDLLTVLMLYFYLTSKTRCMAIMTMINGTMGLVYAVFKFFPSFFAFRGEASVFSFAVFGISVYAIYVYGFICYYAYIGIANFQDNLLMQSEATPTNKNGFGDIESNYSTIPSSAAHKFTAFVGKGTVLG
jgi:hypothetical protein